MKKERNLLYEEKDKYKEVAEVGQPGDGNNI